VRRFRIGIASAATAIEGRSSSDRSIWDVFAAAPGLVADGSGPHRGPRSREFWKQDVELLSDLGVDVYRLSLPWSILVAEPGEWSHYRQLTEQLRLAGIEPMVTLTHYDMPVWVMSEGGWLESNTAHRFAEFAARAAQELGDSVAHWIPMNAPLLHTAYGYGLGVEAPGLTLVSGALLAAQQQLRGHGLAVAALRTAGATSIGTANLHTRVQPETDSRGDAAAAQLLDALVNRAFTDPLFGLAWPDELLQLGIQELDDWSDDDAARIAAPLDFYGVNYYHPLVVRAERENKRIPFALVDAAPNQTTDQFGWPISPDALTDALCDLRTRHSRLPPLWVTETGTQDDGGSDDQHRIAFLRSHLDAVAEANRRGADVHGLLLWTLLDAWEFGEGLSRHFGLVAVDPDTGVRSPKASYFGLQNLLAGR
jgi:beta-glucosidase